MAKLLLLFVICVGLLPVAVQAQENTEFIPGEVWKDTDGNPINAHGGGLLYHNGTYYWYGEYKKGKTVLPEWATWECYRTDVTGVGCYSSKDLLNWKFEGIVLPAVKNDPDHDLHPSKVLERPKVVYNKKTGKFVMWAHVESADYSKACAGVADYIMGTWKTIGNPCTGPDADKTFYAQSTYVQPVIGKKDAYIAMFDRWKKKDLEDSRYVWLPVLIKDGKITIPWHEKWDFSIFDK